MLAHLEELQNMTMQNAYSFTYRKHKGDWPQKLIMGVAWAENDEALEELIWKTYGDNGFLSFDKLDQKQGLVEIYNWQGSAV